MTELSKEEFEQTYAEKSGVTVKWLHDRGQFGVPCDCRETGCRGWQMKHINSPIRMKKEINHD